MPVHRFFASSRKVGGFCASHLGKPPARVSLKPFLRLYKRKDFARCGGRPWALPPDLASLSRKAGPKAFIVNPPSFREDPIFVPFPIQRKFRCERQTANGERLSRQRRDKLQLFRNTKKTTPRGGFLLPLLMQCLFQQMKQPVEYGSEVRQDLAEAGKEGISLFRRNAQGVVRFGREGHEFIPAR